MSQSRYEEIIAHAHKRAHEALLLGIRELEAVVDQLEELQDPRRAGDLGFAKSQLARYKAIRATRLQTK